MERRRLAERLEPRPAWPRSSWPNATTWRTYRPAHEPPAVIPKLRLTPPGPTEAQLHASVAQMLDWLLLPPAFYTTFPAGWGWLPKSTAARLYRCGLKRGMPDVLMFNTNRVVGVELKVNTNKATSDQRAMHAKLWAVGIRVYVCRSLEDVIGVLELESFPMQKHWMDKHGKATSDQSATRSGAQEPAQSARPA